MLNCTKILFFHKILDTLNIFKNKPVEDLKKGGNAESETQAKQATHIG